MPRKPPPDHDNAAHHRITVAVPPELSRRIRSAADDRSTTMQGVILEAVAAWLAGQQGWTPSAEGAARDEKSARLGVVDAQSRHSDHARAVRRALLVQTPEVRAEALTKLAQQAAATAADEGALAEELPSDPPDGCHLVCEASASARSPSRPKARANATWSL